MAWIELHQELPRHPKTARLCAALKVGRAQGVGHLCCLWLWALDFAPKGDLEGLGDAEIAQAAEWTGDAEAFVAALVKARWLDVRSAANELTGDGAHYLLHDWEKFGGRLIEIREASKERMRLSRERYKDVARNKPATNEEPAANDIQTNSVTQHNTTVPNLNTKQTGPKAGPSGPGGVLQNAETATATTESQKSKVKSQNELHTAVAAESAGAYGAGAAPRVAEGLAGTDVAGGGTGGEQARGIEKALGGGVGHLRGDSGGVAAVQDAGGARAVGTAKQQAAVNREWDVFGYALRRGAFVDDKAARRLVAWGKAKNPHALREPFMFVVLGRLLDGCDKRELGTLETGDAVAYAIGWSQNADQAKRERPASARNMKRAMELLAAADMALSKNGTGHRAWMDSLAGEIEAMAAGKKAGAV